jgi:hypothetical protein
MAKRKEPFLLFTNSNINRVKKSILRNLTPDLLPKKWIELNKINPTFGHCHNAAGVFYMIFGSENVHMYRAYDDSLKLVDESMYHRFILNRHTNEIIDITSEQYSSHPQILRKLYRNKEKAGLLGFNYKKRAHTLLKKVKSNLNLR